MNPRIKILLKVAPLVLLLDQLSKWFIVHWLELGDSVAVIPGYFDIIHARNRGAAFGAFANLPDSFRLPFFYLVSAGAVVVILLYFFRLEDPRKMVFANLSLILGGAAGNIADRLFRGEVVDFLSFHWRNQWAEYSLGSWQLRFRLEWPAFNVADAAITIAVVWLMFLMLKQPKI